MIALLAWPQVARLMRGEVMRIKELEFVDAVRCLGMREPVDPRDRGHSQRARARCSRLGTLIVGSGDPARSRAQLPRPLQRGSRELGPHAQQRPALSLQCLVAVRLSRRRDLPHRARLQPARRRRSAPRSTRAREAQKDVADQATDLAARGCCGSPSARAMPSAGIERGKPHDRKRARRSASWANRARENRRSRAPCSASIRSAAPRSKRGVSSSPAAT